MQFIVCQRINYTYDISTVSAAAENSFVYFVSMKLTCDVMFSLSHRGRVPCRVQTASELSKNFPIGAFQLIRMKRNFFFA